MSEEKTMQIEIRGPLSTTGRKRARLYDVDAGREVQPSEKVDDCMHPMSQIARYENGIVCRVCAGYWQLSTAEQKRWDRMLAERRIP